MRRILAPTVIGTCVALLLTACGGGGVDWSKYDATVKSRIDTMEATADCAGLQEEFNTADANNATQRERTGTGNVELMNYLDGLMRDVGCYS